MKIEKPPDYTGDKAAWETGNEIEEGTEGKVLTADLTLSAVIYVWIRMQLQSLQITCRLQE